MFVCVCGYFTYAVTTDFICEGHISVEIKAFSQPGCDLHTELTENDRETDSDGLKVCKVT